jgi:hypothetical protein
VDIPERYVRLCLRLGRLEDGFIDAFIGPSEWEQSVAADEPFDPRRLQDEARLLLDGLDDADLEEDRRRWLRGQLEALQCVAARLSGENIAWTDEVERCYGVRAVRTDAGVFEDIHRRLDTALPGSGTVRERYIAWEKNNVVPREKLVPALERLKEVLRPRAHALAPMPAEESVTYELVSNTPWVSFTRYEGQHRSRIEVNADLPISIVVLVDLAAHEAYPGHHTERTVKDVHLCRGLGRVETSVVVASAPEALVSEGMGMNALEVGLGPQPFDVVAGVLADLDLRFEPLEADEFHSAELALYAVGMNAAFMLHEDGAATEEAAEYLRDWGLEADEKAVRTVAFLADPSSRAYVSAYADGRRLCRDFAERAAGNFTRLLTEQLTSADLLS